MLYYKDQYAWLFGTCLDNSANINFLNTTSSGWVRVLDLVNQPHTNRSTELHTQHVVGRGLHAKSVLVQLFLHQN